MKCTLCNGEMEKGYIQNKREALCWIPEDEERGVFKCLSSPNGVELAKYSIVEGSEKATAYYCRQCKQCIIEGK